MDDGARVEVLQEVIYDMTKTGRFTAQHRADLIEVWQADGVTGRSPRPRS